MKFESTPQSGRGRKRIGANLVQDASFCKGELAVEVTPAEKTQPGRIETIEFSHRRNLFRNLRIEVAAGCHENSLRHIAAFGNYFQIQSLLE
jgi:hypothetical protein